VDLIDAIYLNKAMANIIVLSDTAKKSADCNLDGAVNDEDCSILLQYVIMLIPDLPYQA
jgi:hypothetical protein